VVVAVASLDLRRGNHQDSRRARVQRSAIARRNNAALRRRRVRPRTVKAAYLYIAPFIIVFLLFGAYPDVYTFIVSFQHNSGYGVATPAGWSNYLALLRYGAFWQEVENTLLYWFLHAVILIPFAFAAALVVRSKFVRAKSTWRAIIFLPQVMTFVSVGLVFQIVFASPKGLINNLFDTNIAWLTNFAIAKYVVVSLLVWQGFGFWFVVFLAGLTTLDPTLEDAAIVDGASVVQRTLRVTVPLMKNIIFFAVIIDAIGSMALYTQPNVLTTNGNGLAVPEVGTVSNTLISNLQAGIFGESAAAGVLIFVLTVIVSAILFGGFYLFGGRVSGSGITT
jgi:ABC-type sugar transport system permease subunit